ncbi:hypothetical protein BJ138DRAFT_1090304 [Hygrophoropsis aurantiaca]|uniref:Uncharacterized protein n=1 Tax=Hygrophoropsis aurantiaca TaxID=72124 RepID=A0ACB8A6V8_9AGAM|nr:hypothetical protein BJ138DRAFT_1090304 [Hygrophoropsis aurantiaca]
MSYSPDETAAQIFAEQTWLQGALLSGVGYGVVLALFWLCFRTLWKRIKVKDANHRRNVFFLLYSCVMFMLGSLFMGSNSDFTQLAYINQRNFPGGPAAFEEQMFSIGPDEIANVSFVLANWLADSLMVWRCILIYRDCGTSPWIVVAFPGLMLVASFALGVLFLLQISSPASSPYQVAGTSVNYTFPYFSLSLAINIIVTIMIVIRLLLFRRHIIRVLGPGHITDHTSIAAMIVESASLYSIFSLLFLIPFAANNPVSNVFLQALGEAQFIAPLLIIYREARGRGWLSSPSTMSSMSSKGTNSNAIRLGRFSDIVFATQHAQPTHRSSVSTTDIIIHEGTNAPDKGDETIAMTRQRTTDNSVHVDIEEVT